MGKIVLALIGLAIAGCSLQDDAPALDLFTLTYEFNDGMEGWEAGFTDYPVSATPEADSIYLWQSEFVKSAPITGGRGAYRLSCDNVNGDVFMYIKAKIEGLAPNTNYNLVYSINLVSNAENSQGLFLKAGASDLEPKKVIDDNYYVLNIDKGVDAAPGENAISFGEIGRPPVTDEKYYTVVKDNTSHYNPFIARTNSKGEMWVIIGADSTKPGPVEIYFTSVTLFFSASR